VDLNEGRKRRWAYPFFGLTDEYKVHLHDLIFDLCHYGNIEYNSVYSMPVQYRTFYIRKLSSIKEKERTEYDRASGKQEATPTSKVVRGPAIERR
jgi:hypothetical protein